MCYCVIKTKQNKNHKTTEDSLDGDIHLSLKKHPQTTLNFNEFYVKKYIYKK